MDQLKNNCVIVYYLDRWTEVQVSGLQTSGIFEKRWAEERLIELPASA